MPLASMCQGLQFASVYSVINIPKMKGGIDDVSAMIMIAGIMSIFFILLFYGMPSALTLYLSVSYLLGIVQTIVTNKMMPPVATPSVKNK